MKRDGRTLDHRTLEEFRFLAVRRVNEGETASAVVRSLGLHRTSIYRWLKAANESGKGELALVSRPATGRPTKLTAAQQAQVFEWIDGKNPHDHGLDYGLWTRQLVALLIEQRFALRLGVTAVGRMLARLGVTPQKPLQRAYQRNAKAIERWKHETWPAIAAAARQGQAEVYFWDESGFRADSVHGRTWAPRGHTPVVERPGQRQSISAASAVSAKGGFWFATYRGALNAGLFIELLKALMKGRRKPVHLVVDGLPAHKGNGCARVHRVHQRQAEHACAAGLCPGPQPRRAGVESRQAHRRGAQSAQSRGEAGGPHRAATARHAEKPQARAFILPGT